MKYQCTACEWEGDKNEVIMVPVCPACRTGHIYRLMEREGGVYECPNCSSILTPEGEGNPLYQFKMEPECPMCGCQYLREI